MKAERISLIMPLSTVAAAAGFQLPPGSTTNGWGHVRTLLSAAYEGKDLDTVPRSFWEGLQAHLLKKAETTRLDQIY